MRASARPQSHAALRRAGSPVAAQEQDALRGRGHTRSSSSIICGTRRTRRMLGSRTVERLSCEMRRAQIRQTRSAWTTAAAAGGASAHTRTSPTRIATNTPTRRFERLRTALTPKRIAATVGVTALFVALFAFFSVLPGIIRGDSAPAAVTLDVSAPSLDTSSGSGIPVLVRPQDAPDAQGDLHFIDQHGKGLVLPPGSYLVEVAGSPIAADGTVYDFDTRTFPLSVAHGKADTSGIDRIELAPLAPEDTTRDAIDAAYRLAAQGGCLGDEAVQLKLTALERIGVAPF